MAIVRNLRAKSQSRGSAGLPSKLTVFGSSTFAGEGASSNARRVTSNMARIGRMTEVNEAISGAVLCRSNESNNNGGYATVLQKYAPARTEGPWLSDLGVVILGYNHNDIALFGINTALNQYKAALCTVIDRARSSAVFENTDASVLIGAGFSEFSGVARNSGASYHYATTANKMLTISVPETYSGTDIIIGMVEGVIAEYVPPFTVFVDDEIYPVHTSVNALPNGDGTVRLGTTRRIKGLSPGAHEIAIVTGANPAGGETNFAFDYWAIEAEEPPIVLLPSPFRRLSGYNDAEIAKLTNAMREVAGFYPDGRVVFVDLDAVIGKNPHLFHGDIHLNDRGCAVVSEALLGAAEKVASEVGVHFLV